jgi:hypothetical protein
MRRITTEEAQEFIPLKENFLDQSVRNAEYFTITPSKQGDGWEETDYECRWKRGSLTELKTLWNKEKETK